MVPDDGTLSTVIHKMRMEVINLRGNYQVSFSGRKDTARQCSWSLWDLFFFKANDVIHDGTWDWSVPDFADTAQCKDQQDYGIVN